VPDRQTLEDIWFDDGDEAARVVRQSVRRTCV
jgi:hypothetical protein